MKHIHHIIPKYLGGTDDPSNLAELTIEEHIEAHKKLYKDHGHWQDRVAFLGLSGRIGKEEILRMKQGMANKGKKRTPEQIERYRQGALKRVERQRADGTLELAHKKTSETMKGYIKSAEHRAKLGKAHKGKTVTQETRDKIRKTLAETRAKKKVIVEND